jgi:hypothetical protein
LCIKSDVGGTGRRMMGRRENTVGEEREERNGEGGGVSSHLD